MRFLDAVLAAVVLGLLFTGGDAHAALDHGSRIRQGVIAGGQDHTCALRGSGRVYCWGRNTLGQLGNGATSASEAAPVLVGGLFDVTALTAGENHTCALLASGKVRCWGDNARQQLGNSAAAASSVPVEVGLLSRVVAVTAGRSHACALLSSGSVRCWGDNTHGQLGDGSNIGSGLPVKVSGVTNAIALAAGDNHNCVLRLTGEVACWGLGDEGQTGDPALASSGTPVEVLLQPTVAAITAGAAHTCARTANGQVKCWGRNDSAQLGDAGGADSATPRTVMQNATASLGNVISVVAGEEHSCALTASGTVRCWGGNLSSQLGNNTLTQESTALPVDVKSAGGVPYRDAVAIAAGARHTCMETSEGLLRCWGANGAQQLGAGSSAPSAAAPLKVTGFLAGTNPIALSSSSAGHSCVLLGNGTVKCWGNNGEGQLGIGVTSGWFGGPVGVDTPTEVVSLAKAVAVAVGDRRSCAIVVSGRVYCWGGFGPNANTPVLVPRITTAVSIAVGLYHYCSALSNGRVMCWGFDDYGQVGNGPNPPPDATTPVEVAGLVTNVRRIPSVTGITAALNTSCARLTTGAVRCWGAGANAGADATSAVPKTTKAAAVVAGGGTGMAGIHACALPGTENLMGNRKCWGENSLGQFGNGGTTSTITPVVVQTPSFITHYAPGYQHSCARMADGTARCWGDDTFAQLGNGVPPDITSAPESLLPVTVTDLVGAATLSSGDIFSCALHANGEVRCWGSYRDGRMGNPSVVEDAATPVVVQGL